MLTRQSNLFVDLGPVEDPVSGGKKADDSLVVWSLRTCVNMCAHVLWMTSGLHTRVCICSLVVLWSSLTCVHMSIHQPHAHKHTCALQICVPLCVNNDIVISLRYLKCHLTFVP